MPQLASRASGAARAATLTAQRLGFGFGFGLGFGLELGLGLGLTLALALQPATTRVLAPTRATSMTVRATTGP